MHAQPAKDTLDLWAIEFDPSPFAQFFQNSMDRRLLHRIALIASLLGLTLAVGTAGFRVIEHYSLFDAFYMTLITITTVGYLEVHPLSHAGRIFNSFLILFGVSSMFFSVGALTQTIIELQLEDRFGRGRRRRMIEKMDRHFIVCGYGRVGRSAAHSLQVAGVPFVVIDRNVERVGRAAEAGIVATVADATRDDALRDAGIMRARGFIAALASDADNVFVILSAKTLNPRLTVVTRAAEEGAVEKLRRAGADTVFSPYSITGQRLAQALLRPHVVQFLDFATEGMGPDIGMEQIRIDSQRQFTFKTIGSLLARHEPGIIVLALRKADGQMIFNPSLETEIAAGDVLIAMGKLPHLRSLEALLTR